MGQHNSLPDCYVEYIYMRKDSFPESLRLVPDPGSCSKFDPNYVSVPSVKKKPCDRSNRKLKFPAADETKDTGLQQAKTQAHHTLRPTDRPKKNSMKNA